MYDFLIVFNYSSTPLVQEVQQSRALIPFEFSPQFNFFLTLVYIITEVAKTKFKKPGNRHFLCALLPGFFRC